MILFLACASAPEPGDDIAGESAPPPPEAGEVVLTTTDGLSLVADLWPVQTAGSPAILLLHMNPAGGFHRGNWPQTFIDALNAEGWNVLNLDRRGAGESEGVAQDAFGEPGRLDVLASMELFGELGFGEVAILGASNGTTPMLDYVAAAPAEGWPSPVALGFMTGGGYTEYQTSMAEGEAFPAVFTFSTEERAWSAVQQSREVEAWVFHEYAEGDHGTKMFDAAPEVQDDLLGFYRELWP